MKITGLNCYNEIISVLDSLHFKKIFLVCGSESYNKLPLKRYLDVKSKNIVKFSEFSSNPNYESVISGVREYNTHKCDLILSIGGGSAIDVAKCIRHFKDMDISKDCLMQNSFPDDKTKLVVVPTTAGTGSESTKFAVLYKDGKKYSVSSEWMRPDVVFLDGMLLKSLPMYHKKAAYMDALCQAIESWWSIKANKTSVFYSMCAIKKLIEYRKRYFLGDEEACQCVLEAANMAGEAINITTTTAPHAMSYKMTSLYGIAHGHAVGLCLPVVWKYMINKNFSNIDDVFYSIAYLLGVSSPKEAVHYVNSIMSDMGFDKIRKKQCEIDILANSVNVQRMGNNPIQFTKEEIRAMYNEILE